jgi:hypothetical protein
MSLNIVKTKKNYPLVKIKGGKHNNEIIYLDTDTKKNNDEIQKSFTKLELKDGEFQLIPNIKQERDVITIIGKSGSGKSHFIYNYCLEYKKAYPKREIYLFSKLKEDETLDKLKSIKRVKIDDSLLDEPIEPEEELKECCVIFDDIDGLDKLLSKNIKVLLEILIMQGRHWKTTVLYAGHTIDAKSTDGKRLLNETHYFVYFPWGATRSIRYVLNSYIDLSKDTIQKIKSTNSRWACIGTTYPQVIITEKHLMMVASNE